MRVTSTLSVPDHELHFRFSRSGGPGGQNVNTKDTKVEVILDVANSPSLGPRQRARILQNLEGRLDAGGRLHVVASEKRTQGANREAALTRLKAILADAVRPEPAARRPTRPSRSSVHRRLESKRARGKLKQERSSVPDD